MIEYKDLYLNYKNEIAEHLKTFTKRDLEWRLNEAEKILAIVHFIKPLPSMEIPYEL